MPLDGPRFTPGVTSRTPPVFDDTVNTEPLLTASPAGHEVPDPVAVDEALANSLADAPTQDPMPSLEFLAPKKTKPQKSVTRLPQGGVGDTPPTSAVRGDPGTASTESTPPVSESPVKPLSEKQLLINRKQERIQTQLMGKMASKVLDAMVDDQNRKDRRSGRKSELPKRYKVAANVSLKEALANANTMKAALEATVDEFAVILDNAVFDAQFSHLLTKEQRMRILRTKLFLKEKFTPDGVFERLKARLVTGGDMQDKSTYDDLYSPTAANDSIFAVISIAAFENRDVRVIDLVAAYLGVDVQEGTETFVKLNPLESMILCALKPELKKFLDEQGCFHGKLNKSLYGCVESALNLYNKMKAKLLLIGFTTNGKDHCIFNKVYPGGQVTIALFVDDLLLTGFSADLDSFIKEFMVHFPKIKIKTGIELGYLGMELDFSVKGEASVSMTGFTQQLLKSWNDVDKLPPMRPPGSPATANIFKVDDDSPRIPSDLKKSFHSYSASLLYMAKRSRPDTLLATAFLTTRTVNPTFEDWGKLRRVMAYLKQDPSLALVLRPKGIYVESYFDAAHACHPDGISHSGGANTIGGAPVEMISVKQKIMTKSSCEAEMVALSDHASKTLWLQQFLEEQGYKQLPAPVIWEDNTATIDLQSKGFSSNSRTKHIRTRYFWLHDYKKRGELDLRYIPTGEQTADFFTKALDDATFKRLRKKLMSSGSDVERAKSVAKWW
jgi:hypothetical protein